MISTPDGQPDLACRNFEKAARCGEPSYAWRAGQERRFKMILDSAQQLVYGSVLEDGCGVGMYVNRLAAYAQIVSGLEYDFDRASQAGAANRVHPNAAILCAAGEELPFLDDSFDLVISHEVLEHVRDDRRAVQEMIRTLRPLGRALIFVPNRGYPFETHGIFWHKRYLFGNIPLVNYLPRKLRDRLVPHVRVYTASDLSSLFQGVPVRIIKKEIIFGAYDNIIARSPKLGKMLRAFLQFLEKTPLKFFGLSHFWVVEKSHQSNQPNQMAGSRKS